MGAPPTPPRPIGSEPLREFAVEKLAPVIQFRTRDVQPPSPLYLKLDDVIVLVVRNSLAGLTLNFNYRLLRAQDGELVVGSTSFTPTSDRTQNFFNIILAEGFLLSIQIFSQVGVPKRGQTWVEVVVGRGLVGATRIGYWDLVSDYVGGNTALGWPGGRLQQSVEGPGFLRSITGTTPAPGAEITETVPTTARWRLREFRFTLATSAAVATRLPQFVVDDGANILFNNSQAPGQAASLTIAYNASDVSINSPVTNANAMLAFPPVLTLAAGYRIRTVTSAIQGTDQYSAIQYEVEELIEP